MDYDYSRYCGFSVEKIDRGYWLIAPSSCIVDQIQGPYDTEYQAWLACPKWSRDGHLVVNNIMRMVLTAERELKFFGDLHVYYDDGGVLQMESRIRWRFQSVWYKGTGIDYGHAAVRSHLAYFMRKLKVTGPLDAPERSI